MSFSEKELEITMERLKTLYKKIAHMLENLKPFPKYIVSTLIFLAIGLVFGLVETHFAGPNGLPVSWWSQAFVWTFLGVASAFCSERRRKHPRPVTTYT
ncbi:MAG: hypothetical protein M3537_11475, partial [Chloroflexota bacterium]|nr:hypothetical protein [Chloroflexota bacterium]